SGNTSSRRRTPSVATILPTSFPTTSGRAFTAPYSTSGFGIPFGNQCTISTSCSLRTSMSCSRRSRVIGCCSISAVDPLLLSVATMASPFGVDERPQTAERSAGSGRRITSHGRSYLRLVEGHMPQQRCRTAHATPSAAPREHAPEPLRSQAKMEKQSPSEEERGVRQRSPCQHAGSADRERNDRRGREEVTFARLLPLET